MTILVPDLIYTADTVVFDVPSWTAPIEIDVTNSSFTLKWYARTNTASEGATITGAAEGEGWRVTVPSATTTNFDAGTALIVEYQKVKRIKLVKPTIHKYLAGQVKSQFRRIDADEFTIATLLPVQRFKKASANEVWSDSRSMI